LVTMNSSDSAMQRVGPLVETKALMRDLGVDPEPIIRAIGIESSHLDDEEAHIPYDAVGSLLKACAEATKCPHFGLLLGTRAGLRHLGIPGEMARNSETIGAALRIFCVHHHLNTEGAVAVLDHHNGMASITYAIYEPNLEGDDQICDMAVALSFKALRELLGRDCHLEMVDFSHPEPADLAPYRDYFQTTLRFDTARPTVWFTASWIDEKIPGASAKRLTQLHRMALQENQRGFPKRLRRSIRHLLLSKTASADEVSKLVAMHKRTLNRRLKAQGTTFQNLLDETRIQLAQELLTQNKGSVSEIAQWLGYAHASSFTRAYRRWLGTTPREGRSTVSSAPRRL